MTSSSCLGDESGMTLIELLVAMAVSSVLIVSMVSASLFVQRFIGMWQKKETLVEELAHIQGDITKNLAGARTVALSRSSLKIASTRGEVTSYVWADGQFLKNGRNLVRHGLKLDSLVITSIRLPNRTDSTTLRRSGSAVPTGLYEVFAMVSSLKGTAESLRFWVQNEYAYQKYSQD